MKSHQKIKIRWWKPQLGLAEKKYLKQALEASYPNEGPLTEDFEKKLADLLGCKYALATTSGTAAIFLALKALGIGHNDEVIVPDVTFIATANAVSLTGAKPVLVDVDPQTLCIDPQAVVKAITKKTKAIVPVHVSGRGANMEQLLLIARKYKLQIVEDAAEALLSKYKDKYLGTWGRMGCFSFSAHKTITTGQGGLIVTNDKGLYVGLKQLKDQGRPHKGTGGDDLHPAIGYNFKFTDLQAAVGLGQLTYLKQRIDRLRRHYCIYQDELKNVRQVSLFSVDIRGGEVPQWSDAIVQMRNQLDQYLLKQGIQCRRFWFPVHSQKPYLRSSRNFPNSTRLIPKSIWLPSAYTLSDADIKNVAKAIRKFFNS